MTRYIHHFTDWPNIIWDQEALAAPLAEVRLRQGRLIGLMEGLGFSQRNEAVLSALTQDVVKSSEIEGEILSPDQVRSSVARRLGLDIAGLMPADRRVDGVVQMTLEATQNHAHPLSKERLFGWHVQLFPEPPRKIKAGTWRDDAEGPMRVVSGPIGRERVHCEAPPAERLEAEMAASRAPSPIGRCRAPRTARGATTACRRKSAGSTRTITRSWNGLKRGL